MKILGLDFEIDASQTKGALGADGQVNVGQQRISLANDQCPQQRASTLVHEIIEATGIMLELGLTHQQVCGIEIGVYSALWGNGININPLLKK